MAPWRPDIGSAEKYALDQQRMLLVCEISDQTFTTGKDRELFFPLKEALRRDAALAAHAENHWSCVAVVVNQPRSERGDSSSEPANSNTSSPRLGATASITWICDEHARVLSLLVGAYEPALLAKEVHWCETWRKALSDLPESSQPGSLRDAHLTRVTPKDWKNFLGRQNTRWKSGTPTPLRFADSRAILSAAAAVRDVNLMERFHLSKDRADLLFRFRSRSELEGDCVHLALAEMPWTPLQQLRPYGMAAFLGRPFSTAPIDEQIAWLRVRVLAAEQPIVLQVLRIDDVNQAESTNPATSERLSDRVQALLSECAHREISLEDLRRLNVEFTWNLKEKSLDNAAFVVISANGDVVETLDHRARSGRLVQVLERFLAKNELSSLQRNPNHVDDP